MHSEKPTLVRVPSLPWSLLRGRAREGARGGFRVERCTYPLQAMVPPLRRGDGRRPAVALYAAAGCSTGVGVDGTMRWLDGPTELVVHDIHADAITGGIIAGEHSASHRVFDLALNKPAQRTGTVGLVVATVQEPVAGRRPSASARCRAQSAARAGRTTACPRRRGAAAA